MTNTITSEKSSLLTDSTKQAQSIFKMLFRYISPHLPASHTQNNVTQSLPTLLRSSVKIVKMQSKQQTLHFTSQFCRWHFLVWECMICLWQHGGGVWIWKCLCCAQCGFKVYQSDEGFAQGFERTSPAWVRHSEWMTCWWVCWSMFWKLLCFQQCVSLAKPDLWLEIKRSDLHCSLFWPRSRSIGMMSEDETRNEELLLTKMKTITNCFQ